LLNCSGRRKSIEADRDTEAPVTCEVIMPLGETVSGWGIVSEAGFGWAQRTVEWIPWAVGFKGARDNAAVADAAHLGLCMDAGLSFYRLARPRAPLVF
jgi:hypothetical protein